MIEGDRNPIRVVLRQPKKESKPTRSTKRVIVTKENAVKSTLSMTFAKNSHSRAHLLPILCRLIARGCCDCLTDDDCCSFSFTRIWVVYCRVRVASLVMYEYDDVSEMFDDMEPKNARGLGGKREIGSSCCSKSGSSRDMETRRSSITPNSFHRSSRAHGGLRTNVSTKLLCTSRRTHREIGRL